MRIHDIFSFENPSNLPQEYTQRPVINFLKMMGYGNVIADGLILAATSSGKVLSHGEALQMADALITKGVCDGTTNMWVHAAICGKEAEAHFMERLNRINKAFLNFSTSEHLRTLLNGKTLDLTNNEHLSICKYEMKKMLDELTVRLVTLKDIEKLSAAEKLLLELRMLGDGIIVMQHPDKTLGVKKYQETVNNLRPYVASKELEKRNGIAELLFDSRTCGSVNEIEVYLNRYGNLISKLSQTPHEVAFTIGLSSAKGGHIIGLRKEGENWFLFDSEEMPPKQIDINGLGQAIKHVLERDPGHFDLNNIHFFTRLTTTGKNLTENEMLAKAIQQELNNFNKYSDWGTPLHHAIYKENLTAVEEILQKEDYLSLKNIHGHAPIHIAARVGNVDILNMLIKRGANLEEKDSLHQTPAHLAENAGMIEALKNSGANLESNDHRGRTPLHVAVEKGNLETFNALIDAGANLNCLDQQGKSLLHYAVLANNEEILQKLIDLRLDINLADYAGNTPLHCAAKVEDCIAQTLIDNGADLTAKDTNGQTPLHIAMASNNEEVTTILMAANADIEAEDINGKTPLHHAAMGGNIKGLLALIDAKVDLTKTDKDGRSAVYNSANNEVIMHLALAMHKNQLNAEDREIIEYLQDDQEKCQEIMQYFWDHLENLEEDKQTSVIGNILMRNTVLGSFFKPDDITKLRELIAPPQLKASGIEVEAASPSHSKKM